MRNPIKAFVHSLKSGLRSSDEEKLVEAIDRAEEGNRGEVMVHVEAECPTEEPLARAEELFGELGMHETEDRTGVLLYVADMDRKCAVYADEGIFESCGQDFWDHVVDEVAEGYREKKPIAGLVQAVDEIGDVLREQVPGEDTEGDELPDEVSVGD